MFADISLSTEAVVVIGALGSLLVAAVYKLHSQLMQSKDDQVKSMQSQRDSYREMADEAIKNLETIRSERQIGTGMPSPSIVAAVVPEHNSPTTQTQQDSADLQTMRARLVAATLSLGLPARKAAPMEELPPLPHD